MPWRWRPPLKKRKVMFRGVLRCILAVILCFAACAAPDTSRRACAESECPLEHKEGPQEILPVARSHLHGRRFQPIRLSRPAVRDAQLSVSRWQPVHTMLGHLLSNGDAAPLRC